MVIIDPTGVMIWLHNSKISIYKIAYLAYQLRCRICRFIVSNEFIEVQCVTELKPNRSVLNSLIYVVIINQQFKTFLIATQ